MYVFFQVYVCIQRHSVTNKQANFSAYVGQRSSDAGWGKSAIHTVCAFSLQPLEKHVHFIATFKLDGQVWLNHYILPQIKTGDLPTPPLPVSLLP